MSESITIRKSKLDDWPILESLYPESFPDEDLLPLLRSLLPDEAVVISLVLEKDAEVSGHVVFTKCGVSGSDQTVALLGPLAIAPKCQKQGLGRGIVQAGMDWVKNLGLHLVLVLGDPNYYQRLGFSVEREVEPPYTLPPEWDGAWQSQLLGEERIACAGTLVVPSQWADKSLWLP